MKIGKRELVNFVNFRGATAICNVVEEGFASQMRPGTCKFTKFTCSQDGFMDFYSVKNHFHNVFMAKNTAVGAVWIVLHVLLLTIKRASTLFVLRIDMKCVNFVNFGFLKFTRPNLWIRGGV